VVLGSLVGYPEGELEGMLVLGSLVGNTVGDLDQTSKMETG
jgi:hypothetical protein